MMVWVCDAMEKGLELQEDFVLRPSVVMVQQG